MLRYDARAGGIARQVGQALRGLVFGSLHRPTWREWAGTAMQPATAWPLSQLVAAELDLAMLSGTHTRAEAALGELGHYRSGGAYAPHPVSHGGRSQVRYFDDNAWLGLDLVQAYRVTGQRRHLEAASALVPFLDSGTLPEGGILWRERDEDPSLNTCANAPTTQFFLALHRETGEAAFLERARRLAVVLETRLRRPDGLYRDNLRVADPGRTEETLWSYNQGAAIGALVQLAAVETGAGEVERLLDQASTTASATLARVETERDWLWKQPPAFVAVFFRNLLKLDRVRPDPAWRNALAAYLDRARSEARNPGNGAYELGGIGRYDGGKATGITLIDQAAMAQMLSLPGLTGEEIDRLG